MSGPPVPPPHHAGDSASYLTGAAPEAETPAGCPFPMRSQRQRRETSPKRAALNPIVTGWSQVRTGKLAPPARPWVNTARAADAGGSGPRTPPLFRGSAEIPRTSEKSPPTSPESPPGSPESSPTSPETQQASAEGPPTSPGIPQGSPESLRTSPEGPRTSPGSPPTSPESPATASNPKKGSNLTKNRIFRHFPGSGDGLERKIQA